jgi:tetratricopeptide (TPR) repeat protein
LQRLADLKPGAVQAHLSLAEIRHWLGEHTAALAAYRAVLALEPGHAAALVGLANAAREAGDKPLALAAARDAVARHPQSAASQAAFAACLEPRAAASAWREAVRLEPDGLAGHLGLAFALIEAGEPAQALIAATRACTLQPQATDAWFAQGAALAALHRHGEAIAALERADPNRAATQLALGAAYAELENVAEAERRLKAAIALDPAMAEAHASLGAVYLMADRAADARAAYEAALAVNPDLIEAHQSLAGLLADAGEGGAARRHRDIAYRRQCVFVEAAAEPERRVLILSTAEGGNVPFHHLLPKDRYTRIIWYVAYAQGHAAPPEHDLVFNAIGDADLAGPTAANVAAFLAASDRPLLNDPAKVARTARHLTPGLLAGLADVVVPPTVRVTGADLAAAPPLPLLVRPIGSHGGKGLRLARTPADIALAPDQEAYLTAFHDFRSTDGLYRKYRMIFVDRRPYPYHLAISPRWLVHHGSAGMAGDAARIAEELGFLFDPREAIGDKAMAAVQAIGERLDLDYAGLDFSVLPGGEVLVFEANATMLVHPEPAGGEFAHKNPFVRTILGAFQAMVAG